MPPCRLTRPHCANIVLLIDNPEVALRLPTKKLLFYTEVEKTESNMPQPLWKAGFSGETVIALDTVPQFLSQGATEKPRRDVEESLGERCIGDEAKATGKQLVTVELTNLAAEL